jgi:probable phosphoglycerate mutase
MARVNGVLLARLVSCLALLAALLNPAGSIAGHDPLVVFLVRHAEKTDAGQDPRLSSAGQARARALAETLRDAGISYIHSSGYVRTRDTAAPLANQTGLAVELYDPRNLPALVEKLRATGGRHLVVGHSNTTPQLAELLTGEAAREIDEAVEFDRVYIVTIPATDPPSRVLLRYGAPNSW